MTTPTPDATAVFATARTAARDVTRTTAAAFNHFVHPAAAALLALYLWQIFYTMPHVAAFNDDSRTYFHLTPHRPVAVYYFSRAVFACWNDFYALAIAQGLLLGAAGLFLFYALRRTTGSAFLALSALAICLFKVHWVVYTQFAASDSLFITACVALLAASILIWKSPSPVHIGLFVLFGFLASFIRPIGPAIVWSLLLVLALRFWWNARRAVVMLLAGCIGIHAMNAAIEFVHVGSPAPAQLGLAMIGGTAFIADDNASPDIPYAREFAASTSAYREEYEAADSWAQKYTVMNDYYNPITWGIAFPKVLARLGSGPRYSWDDMIAANRRLQDISFAAVRHNPAGYARMTLVKVVAGISMFSGDEYWKLQTLFTRGFAHRRISFAQSYYDKLPLEPRWTRFNYDDEISRLAGYIRDWRTTPLDLKYDLARPLRDLVGLLGSDVVRRAFVFETAILVITIVGLAWRRRAAGDRIAFLLLFVVPPWLYLLAISLTHIPIFRYMEVTSLFVSMALLSGGWVAAQAVAQRFRLAPGSQGSQHLVGFSGDTRLQ